MFSAVVYASEESVINAMVATRTMTGADYCVVPALPQGSATGDSPEARDAEAMRNQASPYLLKIRSY